MSIKDTFVRGEVIAPENNSLDGLNNLFKLNLGEINVLEGIPVRNATNQQDIPSTSRSNPPRINNDPPLGSAEQTRRLFFLQLEAFYMLIRLVVQGQTVPSTSTSIPPPMLRIPHPVEPLFNQLQSLLGRIESCLGDLRARYEEPPLSRRPERPVEQPQNHPQERRAQPQQSEPLKRYDGRCCPIKHMITFCKLYELFRFDDATLILLFGITLKDEAYDWFTNFAGKDRMTWKSFSACFLRRFNRMWHVPSYADLLNLSQNESERFCDYVDRWFAMADELHQHTPPLGELIKIAIRSLRPPLRDLLASHTFKDFKELKAIGESYDRTGLTLAPPMKRPREVSDPLRLELGTPRLVSNRNNYEPEQYCVYHRTVGHRTEFCADLRRVLNVQTNETVTQNPSVNREPQRPQSPERPHSVHVITNLDMVVDPITTIQPINGSEPDLTNEHQTSNPVLDLNPDDDELPSDYFENYDVQGRLYVNKKL